jgi:hypothetical protein
MSFFKKLFGRSKPTADFSTPGIMRDALTPSNPADTKSKPDIHSARGRQLNRRMTWLILKKKREGLSNEEEQELKSLVDGYGKTW